ncbi:hypothetical protein HanRHA438_Chr06g0271291 [Helianthus annuus]|uniref:Uncharacterized protein n=1 Tax=Helianthus annuus TaxID=4232 RepID=A0A251T2H5_HELAN|nr:hypothetical protein HanXRQr2_Chr09g0387041 [Helianthus annuus]KAF5802662.1 hypothetical protein HanXRQr2_Chr06g0262141 [Helianthus annuus]KAF5812365.1 hypothetical protein HanXRQr2_Chr04g0191761 [Helianthus annuus]KAJ0476941.1 hypothetical protein HanHA300_Chr13g0482881 [Helianthus annuus]KAJ0481300.1 hypothetical protein HanIR_Chr13g0641091 [Helianthus annuus]
MWFIWSMGLRAMARYALDFLSPKVDVTPVLWNFFGDALNLTVSQCRLKGKYSKALALGLLMHRTRHILGSYFNEMMSPLEIFEGQFQFHNF